MNTSSRREGFLIEPYKQLRFGITFIVTNLIFSGLILAVFGYFIYEIYQAQTFYFQLDQAQSAEILTKLQQPIVVGSGLLVLFILTTFFWSVRYTHQFYGPLVSIGRYLDEISEGTEPKPIQLRSSDQLRDLADRLNQLRGRVSNSDSCRVVESYLDDLIAGKDVEIPSVEAKDSLAGIIARLNKMNLKQKN